MSIHKMSIHKLTRCFANLCRFRTIRSRLAVCLIAMFVLAPVSGDAHHSVRGTFDTDTVVEKAGVVTEVRWQNPHVRFTVAVTDEDGELWEIETTSLSTLRRRQLAADFLSPGDEVRIAGSPAINGDRELYVRNILLPSGEEVLLQNSVTPRWSQQVLGAAQDDRQEGDRSAPELGIFRVWSTPVRNSPIWKAEYPLTAAAQASVAAFDPAVDSPTLNCAPKGMPTIMEQPYPMEFRDDGDRILFLMEEYNTVRPIHLTDESGTAAPVASRLGYSTGRWEGQTLIVDTTAIDWDHFDRDGIPLGSDARIVERFTLAEEGSRLNYEMTVIDPDTFTEPVVMEKFWLWFPEVVVERYDCVADE